MSNSWIALCNKRFICCRIVKLHSNMYQKPISQQCLQFSLSQHWFSPTWIPTSSKQLFNITKKIDFIRHCQIFTYITYLRDAIALQISAWCGSYVSCFVAGILIVLPATFRRSAFFFSSPPRGKIWEKSILSLSCQVFPPDPSYKAQALISRPD